MPRSAILPAMDSLDRTFVHLSRRLRDGAPPALPALVDRVAEWWVTRTPRHRTLLVAGVVLVVALRGLGLGQPPLVEVVVATRDLAAGQVLAATDLRTEVRPRRSAPSASIEGPAEAHLDRVVAVPVPAGAVLAGLHLHAMAPADLAPEGHVALAVPADELPALAPGAIVDLHGGEGVSVLGAVVLGTVGDTTWLGVPRERAGDLVAAMAWGPIRAAVVPVARLNGR